MAVPSLKIETSPRFEELLEAFLADRAATVIAENGIVVNIQISLLCRPLTVSSVPFAYARATRVDVPGGQTRALNANDHVLLEFVEGGLGRLYSGQPEGVHSMLSSRLGPGGGGNQHTMTQAVRPLDLNAAAAAWTREHAHTVTVGDGEFAVKVAALGRRPDGTPLLLGCIVGAPAPLARDTINANILVSNDGSETWTSVSYHGVVTTTKLLNALRS